MRRLLCVSFVVAAFVPAARGQPQSIVVGQWMVTLDFPQLQVTETVALDFRPSVRSNENGRPQRGFRAVRQRPELGPSKRSTYFLRLVNRRMRLIIDDVEMCEVAFDSYNSFSGTCSMIGIPGTIMARRLPTS